MKPIDVATAPELFAVACPRCAAAVAVGADLVGAAAGCPVCRKTFLVPAPERPSAAAVAPPADPAWHDVAATLADAAGPPPDRHPEMEFREPVSRLETADGSVELCRLSDDERRLRRSRRSLIMLLVGTTILIALAAALGRPSTRHRSRRDRATDHHALAP